MNDFVYFALLLWALICLILFGVNLYGLIADWGNSPWTLLVGPAGLLLAVVTIAAEG